MTDKNDRRERFWRMVEQTPTCWLYRGRINPDGYGRLGEDFAHRLAWEYVVGPIPAGLHIDHLCRVRNCVNPAHLEPVTPGENARRGNGHTNGYDRWTHCTRGHEFSEENTYRIGRRQQRVCRTCRLASVAAYRKRLKAKAAA